MISPRLSCVSILSLQCLASSVTAGSMPSEYKCNGNEPFWGLAIDNERAGWATPAEPEGKTLEGTFQLLDYAGVFSWRGDFGAGDLVAFVTDQPCSDTMVDRDYPYTVRLSLPDGRVLLGCCDTSSEPSTERWSESPASPSDAMSADKLDQGLAELPVAILDEKPPGDWSRHLLVLLPAIEACLAATPGTSPRAVKAWPTNGGRVGVRTWGSEAAGFECVATGEGSVLKPLTPLQTEALGLNDDWSPLFSPAGQGPPDGECYQHERVVGADGELIGWLSYDVC